MTEMIAEGMIAEGMTDAMTGEEMTAAETTAAETMIGTGTTSTDPTLLHHSTAASHHGSLLRVSPPIQVSP